MDFRKDSAESLEATLTEHEAQPRILLGGRVFTREEWFQEVEKARRERAQLPFEEKIRILVQLQRLARDWGGHPAIIVWKI
ncbi:MAG: hypothetical protein N3B68_12060 [Anaerolineae bacterium]|nr:hypothetical protein [Anaerolineae bacterium]